MNRREFLQISAAALAAGGLDAADAQTRPANQTSPATQPVQRPGRGGMFNGPVDPVMAAKVKQLGSRGVRVHDPSTIVQCKDEYWVFYTGRGVPSYRSKDLITWQAGPPVFTATPAWIATALPQYRGMSFWAPDVGKVGDRYLLYYAASVFGKNTSVLGLATNPTLDPADPAYKWSDGGIVAQSGAGDQFNVIDPAILNDPADGLWLSFGSYWSGIKLIQLDPATGKRLTPDAPMYPLAHAHDIEASYIYRHGAYYYLFVNWGVCCRGVNSTYNIRIGRGRTVTGPYLDKAGVDMMSGGGTLLVGTDGPFVGPGHAGIITANGKDWLSMHFYDGSRGGMSALAIRAVSWDEAGWPLVGMG